MPDLTDADASGPVVFSRARGRLDATHAELKRLSEALARRPHPEERAILAGALLGTTGYLLRRTRASTASPGAANSPEHILAELPREDVQSWLTGASAAGLRRTLQQAADAAFEAALSEEEGEREGYKESALEGLAERERLASVLHALGRWEQLHGALDDRARRRRDALAHEIARVDEALRSSAVALTHLNDERRAERDLLDQPLRSTSWWYGHLADSDELAAITLGASPTLSSLPRALELLDVASNPPTRHLSPEELWALDLGTLGDDQRAWVQRHAASCAGCRRDLQALSDGEEALLETLGLSAPRQAVETEHEVIFEHPQFRVLAFRATRKPRLVLEEKRQGALASAHPLAGVKPRRLRNGFEFQLPPRGKEPLRLQVLLASGEEVSVPV